MALFSSCPGVAVLPFPCASPKPGCWLHTWYGAWKCHGIAHVTQALHSGAVSSHQATSCWTRATKRCLNKPRNLDSKYSGKQSEQDCMGTHLRPWWVVGWLSLALQMPQPHHPAEALLQTTHAQHKAISTNYLIYQCVKFSPLS